MEKNLTLAEALRLIDLTELDQLPTDLLLRRMREASDGLAQGARVQLYRTATWHAALRLSQARLRAALPPTRARKHREKNPHRNGKRNSGS